MRATQKELDQRKSGIRYFLLSLLIHISILVLLFVFLNRRTIRENRIAQNAPVQVVLFSKKQIEKFQHQVVETNLVHKTQKAAKNAYMGQQTQVVEKQTKARNTGRFARVQKSGGRNGRRRGHTGRAPVKLSDLGVRMNFNPLGNLGHDGQVAATDDYLKDVEQGAQTLLNTKEFKYYSYYRRVRSQIEQFWSPSLNKQWKKMMEQGRNLASNQEFSTRLLVIMNRLGVIKHIRIESTSGFLDLDQAAIDAFNRAGSFPNPPKGMIENNGMVRLEWEFVLKT